MLHQLQKISSQILPSGSIRFHLFQILSPPFLTRSVVLRTWKLRSSVLGTQSCQKCFPLGLDLNPGVGPINSLPCPPITPPPLMPYLCLKQWLQCRACLWCIFPSHGPHFQPVLSTTKPLWWQDLLDITKHGRIAPLTISQWVVKRGKALKIDQQDRFCQSSA